MEINQEQQNGYEIISLIGRLDANTASELEAVFQTLTQKPDLKIIVQCAGLDYISSAGLRVLLTTAKTLKLNNGKIGLCMLNPNVKQVFDISGFTSIFPIFDTLEEALENLDKSNI
ncbi:MAG: hypothetical protein AUJ82_02785 [Verrucomicrobia bacterium CG1_02_43_26]|nr:MAG: hypothetical protein AUJ82_02785 [Verrucomicrobia bacterium CG1_02_43_26]